jgi:HlyD family secretion protein
MELVRSLSTRPLYWLLPIVAAALTAWAFWPRALPVETGSIRRGPLSVGFTEEGRTRLRHSYHVTAPVDGFLQRVALEAGDAVAAGDVLAVLQPASARLLDPATQVASEAQLHASEHALAAAQAALLAARAVSSERRAELARAQALSRRQLVSAAELELAHATARAADAEASSAAANVEQARAVQAGARQALRLQGMRSEGSGDREVKVRAPVAGRILRRFVESEGPVQAGQALFDVGDPADLEAEVEILSADAVTIAPGTPVQLARWGGDATLPGHVRLIEPGAFTKVSALGVEEQRVRALVSIDAPASVRIRLGDGYRVDARFQAWSADGVLQVPIAGLFRDGEQWAVYALEGGRARLRHLRLGHFGERSAEVLAGLAEGDQVVLYPADKVRDGTPITAHKPPR